MCIALALFVGCTPTGKIDPPSETPSIQAPTNPTFTPHASAEGVESRLTADSEKLVAFSQGTSSDFHFANGYSNGDPFNCIWRERNGVFDDVLSMSVTAESGGYAGAEYRSRGKYGYGFFAVRMKAAACSGVISSFFTYTGPSNGDPWDEIDIEFLGRDMSIVQFNYYTNGVGGHEFLFDLGFDASKKFHEYAFDWQPDSITWYVDGIAVYRVTDTLPVTPAQIMMNVWNPIKADWSDKWSGPLDETALPATAQYEWIAYSAT